MGRWSYSSLTQIGLDTALRVVGRDAEEGERTFADLGIYGSKGVDLTQCTPQHAEGSRLQVVIAHERLGVVATVGADALVAVFGKVVVPVQQGRSLARSQRQGIHRHGTGEVGFAGGRNQPCPRAWTW